MMYVANRNAIQFGAVMVLIRHYAYNGRFAKYRVYHPNMYVP